MRLKGKVAVVTGSTRGIGQAIAIQFAREGAAVVVSGRRGEAGATVVREIQKEGRGRATFVRADIGSEADVRTLMQEAVNQFGSLNVLVNCASPMDLIKHGEGSITDIEVKVWEEIVRVGLNGGTFLTMRYAIPHMRAAGGGSIINISGTAAVIGLQDHDATTAIKGAMQALTRSVAAGYGKEGIRCNALVVGLVPGDHQVPQEYIETRKKAISTLSIGTPIEAAYACVWLASDESAYVTGALVPFDGGVTVCTIFPSVKQLGGIK